jgi:hypothetical protein
MTLCQARHVGHYLVCGYCGLNKDERTSESATCLRDVQRRTLPTDRPIDEVRSRLWAQGWETFRRRPTYHYQEAGPDGFIPAL